MGIEILSLKCGLSEATYSSSYPMKANFEFDPNKEHSVRCPVCNKRIQIYLGKYSADGRVVDFFDEHRSFFVSNIEQRGYVWPRIKQGEKNSPRYQPERPPRVNGPDIKAYGGEDKLSIDKHDRYWVICAMVIVVIILITSILSWSV